jgi:DNA-directed RNA polymerase subunit RPC12/RpoP
VLDYGGVVAACGPLDRPAVDTDGAAQDRARASREKLMEEMGYRVVRCEECGVFYFPPVAEAPPCPDCGHRQTIFERIKNTKDSAEAGELYAGLSEHEWMKSWVTGLHMELHEEALVLEFATKTLGRESKHIVTLYAPPYSGKPTPPQMGQLRRTKMWCRDYFGAPPHLAARAMCRWVIENAKVMPRMLRQLDSGDYVAEGSQPRSTVASLEEAQQERLL